MFAFISKGKTMWLVLALAPAVFAPALLAEVRVSKADTLRLAVKKPAPEYPNIARQMKVTGHVEVEATVATDGSVEAVKVLTGNPLLTSSAVTAVKKWMFPPFTENGEPAKAIALVAFDFNPQQ